MRGSSVGGAARVLVEGLGWAISSPSPAAAARDHSPPMLHAGRQTGKTTSAMWLEQHLEATGRWRALWVDLETAREKPDVVRAMTALLEVFDDTIAARHPALPRPEAAERDLMLATPDTALLDYLRRLAERSPSPLVLLLDEAPRQ